MLGQVDGLLDAKNVAATKVEEEALKLRAEQAQLTKTKARLANEECPVSVCPYCFYMSQKTSALTATDPTPDGIDQLKCKTCHNEWQQPD